MTKPGFDLIRDALDHEAGTYSPLRPGDQARQQLLERLRRRRQRDRLVLGSGMLAVLLAAGIAMPRFLSDADGERQIRTSGGQMLDVAADGSGVVVPSEGDVGFGVPVTDGTTVPISVSTVPPPATTIPPQSVVTSPPPPATSVTTTPAPSTTAAPVTAAGSGIAGRLVRDPGCPARTDPPQSGCSTGPAQGAVQVLRPDGGIVASAQTASDGSFRLDLTPGQYVVQAAPSSACAAAPVRVVVESGRHIPVALTCDSGVR